MKLQKGPFDWCLSVYIFIWFCISFDTLDILGNFDMIYQNLYFDGYSSCIYEIKPAIPEIVEYSYLIHLFCVCYRDDNCIFYILNIIRFTFVYLYSDNAFWLVDV